MHVGWDRAAGEATGRFRGPFRFVSIASLYVSFVADRDRWALWLPVLLGAGIAVYFSLDFEPDWRVSAVALLVGLVAVLAVRRHPALLLICVALATLAAGFGRAQLQTVLVAAPVLQKRMGPVRLSGRVAAVSPYKGDYRILLETLSVRGLDGGRTPERIRLRVSKGGGEVRAGDRVRILAILMPPPRPAAPGAFDFSRRAYFQRIGAVGFALGAPRVKARADTQGFGVALARLRRDMTERILRAIPAPAGSVAAALMTGERGAIPEDVLSAMRDSGLAHLLAISGLHIGLVAGILFLGLRFVLAAVEPLALRHPIKKWAAVGSLAGAFAYLLISGATVPTQRAFLMSAVVIVAVLFDRTAISMRLVAWAAATVLLLLPESLLSASFQLSFAAVAALVAVYEVAAPRLSAMRRGGFIFRRAWLYLAGIMLTTVVAGLATGPFAAFHFNRLAVFGVAANLLAVPVTGFWIMPWAVIAFALMPFGLEGLALVPMGWGIEAVLSVARTVSGWPGASAMVAAPPMAALGLVTSGGLWLCLWRRRWRLWGLPVIGAGLAAFALGHPPDVLIGRDGAMLAVRLADGRYATRGRSKVVRDIWLRRGAAAGAVDWPGYGFARDAPMGCDPSGCVMETKGRRIAVAWDRGALEEDCHLASIVLALVPVRRRHCASPEALIRPYDLWRRGAHAIWLADGGIVIESVEDTSGDRPWARFSRHGASHREKRRSRRPDRRYTAVTKLSRAASARRVAPAP